MSISDTLSNILKRVPDENLTQADNKIATLVSSMLALAATAFVEYLVETKVATTLRTKAINALTKRRHNVTR